MTDIQRRKIIQTLALKINEKSQYEMTDWKICRYCTCWYGYFDSMTLSSHQYIALYSWMTWNFIWKYQRKGILHSLFQYTMYYLFHISSVIESMHRLRNHRLVSAFWLFNVLLSLLWLWPCLFRMFVAHFVLYCHVWLNTILEYWFFLSTSMPCFGVSTMMSS